MTRSIEARAMEVREQLKTVIARIFDKYGGAISLDEWTDKCRKISYFGLTMHYLVEVEDRLEISNRVLLIREISAEGKDGAYLRDKITEYMKE